MAEHGWERFRRFLTWYDLVDVDVVTQAKVTDRGLVEWRDSDGTRWRLDPATGERGSSTAEAEPSGRPDDPWGPRRIRPAEAEGSPDIWEVLSPDGTSVLTETEHDLALRDVNTGAVRVLTRSGSALRPWRANAQVLSLAPTPPVFSPDGTRVVSLRVDLTGVDHYPLLDWSVSPPRVDMRAYPVEAGSGMPDSRLAFVSVVNGEVTWSEPMHRAQFIPGRWVGDTAFLGITCSPDGVLSLLRVDAATGAAKVLARERIIALHCYLPAALSAVMTEIPGFDGYGWTSDRDGALRLYLVPADGGDPVPVTPPGAEVAHIVGPTADGGILLLARTDLDHPYDLRVCRTDAQGGFEILTELPGTHDAALLGDGSFFIDTHSSRERPPRADLRRCGGAHVAVLGAADVGAVTSLCRGAAETFTVKADDGVTDLHGVLYLPPGFSPDRSYPVIDSIYAGPQTVAQPNRFVGPKRQSRSAWTHPALLAEAFAQLGFIGVVLDARGTPGRGREFQEAAAHGFGTVAVRDHTAAIASLAAARPWLDKTRCGAIGLSFGGYFAARCGLLAPETFRAFVAAAGPYDFGTMMPGWFQSLLGTSFPDDPQAFADAGLVAHAAEIRSEVMLVHGTHDTNVPLQQTMKLSDALARAGKQHELVILQGATHQIAGTHQVFSLETAARFFLRNLAPSGP
ncbi:S9 family peptidase [Streptomyces oryzae]|uniref:S9 family peptidase n=1 Tax=Streptomyces oryzae TaxID=1434886 RepID=A0ABS3XAT5_9ACTN|nr:prolyl oligopeptidase family serine peptidase [Streptomyces oryzae]MBO8192451.1 S9 family peptidase [Streptomyces oryzae]